MNKKGFTLIELLVVIALLGFIIGFVVISVSQTSKKSKEKILLTKIKNIEKAAVLYGQNHRDKFNTDGGCNIELKHYDECMNIITVQTLIDKDTDGKSYINADDQNGNIINPIYKDKYLNECEIQIYKKYGKIYAVYLHEDIGDSKCWK